jgi:glycosyltransferase involved in cell wall biosynthesis
MIEVSIVTPTYNRREFIPALIQIYRSQTFSKEKMEWIILDDGRDKVGDLFEEAARTIPNIRYLTHDEKLRIGAKRNMLNKEAKGAIIIAMDDDDFYPPDRVAHVVKEFKNNPKIDLAGSSEMHLWYMDTQKVHTVGPYHSRHATNGTMAWRKSYSDIHRYNEFVTHGEESSFLDAYKHPMIQLTPKKTILVICHDSNTFDKMKMREEQRAQATQATQATQAMQALQSKQAMHSFAMRDSSFSLEHWVKDPSLREFYYNLKHKKRD